MRCLSSWQREDERVHEERITLWRTGDLDEAIARAEVEARHCAEDSTDALGESVTCLGLTQGHLLADEPGQGGEVSSLMGTSTEEPREYLDTSTTGAERSR